MRIGVISFIWKKDSPPLGTNPSLDHRSFWNLYKWMNGRVQSALKDVRWVDLIKRWILLSCKRYTYDLMNTTTYTPILYGARMRARYKRHGDSTFIDLEFRCFQVWILEQRFWSDARPLPPFVNQPHSRPVWLSLLILLAINSLCFECLLLFQWHIQGCLIDIEIDVFSRLGVSMVNL